MTIQKSEIILLCPTPGEYAGVSEHLKNKVFTRLHVTVVESGPGKINAALKLASEISVRNASGKLPAFVAGAGTSGSLDASLRRGELTASIDSIVSDWRHEDGEEVLVGPYGTFDYEKLTPLRAEKMAIRCEFPLIKEFMGVLSNNNFKVGRILTADSFVAGKDHKLSLGLAYKALVCDMESGAFAWTARKLHNIPWFNLRIVADTLDERLEDYFKMESAVTDALGKKTLVAMEILNSLLERDVGFA
jgi:nucleoside phosphorylase